MTQLLGTQGSLGELNRALAERIASGEADLQTPGLAEHLWQTTMDKLAVDQPNYAAYRREMEREVARIVPDAAQRGLTGAADAETVIELRRRRILGPAFAGCG